MSPSHPLRISRVAAVMFDLDGTLIETMQAFADLAAGVMTARHGIDRQVARRRYLETSGIPFHQQLEVICPGHEQNQAASDDFEQQKRAVCDATRMDADTVAGLSGLRDQGIKLVVSSNTSQRFVDEFAAREPVPFDLALGFDGASNLAKGEPHVVRTCQALGLGRDQVLFVGDSLKDAELAEATGLAFVGRRGTFGSDDFRRRDPFSLTIGNVAELPGLLSAIRYAA